MNTIDDRVRQIAELAWAIIADRNAAGDRTGFEGYVYESTTEFLIGLDEDFKQLMRRPSDEGRSGGDCGHDL